MFKEDIEIIELAFKEFQGKGMYLALFFISMLYIFLKEKDKMKRIFFVYYPIIVLIVILNPIFHKMVGFIFTWSVYWRVFWMLPLGIVIAYAAVLLINNTKEKMEKIVVVISVFLIIFVSGSFIYNKDNYQENGNAYKIPDESVLVTQLIGIDDSDHKKAIVPETMVGHVRQIDASIELLYSRVPEGYMNHPIVSELNNGNVKFIASLAIEKNCNYIVFKKATVLQEPMEDYGFSKLNETENYAIYKLSK